MNPTDLVSRETINAKKEIYRDLLFRWNKQIALVQDNSLEEFNERHWNDSIQLLTYIDNPTGTVFDIGSGGGFPGVVLGIHGLHVTLTDIIMKKVIFLKEALRVCSLPHCHVLHDAGTAHKTYDIVTSRAFSTLKTIFGYQLNVSRETTIGLHLKGKNYEEELEESRKIYNFSSHIFPSQTSTDGVIIRIENLTKK
ncbi:MAG: 16S rRNA (guanine(527)-N(7))-methyltransferase RsmG [Alphaproteobacteria bacterium]|nr:16S rRNA (guanine(527)-N(7))-methyltransferase RsmG [Alphaproteobacteria bacterium]